MRVAERILLVLSREVKAPDLEDGLSLGDGTASNDDNNALSLLETVFPSLKAFVLGKRVLDYGCGEGRQVIALASYGATEVVGLDTNTHSVERAKRRLADAGGLQNVRFIDAVNRDDAGTFDTVISQDAMEHYPYPEDALVQMLNLAKPGGSLLITFGPPWYAPWGSHMHFFTRVPWVNILFSERTVMAVRSRYRSDGAQRYEDVESGLNKMSLAKFDRIIRSANLRLLAKRNDCVKGLNFLGHVPGLRELLVNRVSVILKCDQT